MQAQEQAELAQLQLAKQKALEQRDAQMRQLDDLKARILAERYDSPHTICTNCTAVLTARAAATADHAALLRCMFNNWVVVAVTSDPSVLYTCSRFCFLHLAYAYVDVWT